MRPNQQSNKSRQRGRSNNGGRKHQNPLSRNYESNGPDVKVRGNAAHVAEKYLQLARDAQSSGDSVMAENYLQHAEHYFRIVSAAQQQQMARSDQPNQQSASDEDDDFPPINDRFSSPEPANRFPQQQQQQQPQQQQGESRPQPAESGETAEGTPGAAAAQGDEQGAQGEGEGQRRRERRRRRRGAAADGADPGEAPQPEVELPAFLTGSSAAAE